MAQRLKMIAYQEAAERWRRLAGGEERGSTEASSVHTHCTAELPSALYCTVLPSVPVEECKGDFVSVRR